MGWAGVLGSGTIAGIGFTVSLLIADPAFPATSWPRRRSGAGRGGDRVGADLAGVPGDRAAAQGEADPALLGDTEQILDLIPAVDPDRDHIRGPADASVTLVEYGDFECPYCGQAEPVVRELLADADLRYVWRHLPLTDVHPRAQIAAEAAEAAAAQGRFWEMHDLLLSIRTTCSPRTCSGTPTQLGLDSERFHDDLMRHRSRGRVAPGRRIGRPERGVGHADVLRQRPAALRRVRHPKP